MTYIIKCWVPINVEMEEEQLFFTRKEAEEDLNQISDQFPENHYEIIEAN